MPTRGAADHSYESLLAAFLEDLRVRRRSLSAQQKGLQVLPRLFLHLRDQGVADARAASEAHLVSFARDLALSKTKRGTPLALWSQSAYLATVRAFFAFLARRNILLRNPAEDLPLPVGRRLPRSVLSEAQARRLVSAPFPSSVIGKRDRAILETLYGTGIRRGECLRLEVTDLDLSQAILLVRNGKGSKDRLVPVPGRAALALDTYLREARPELLRNGRERALFLSVEGRRLCESRLDGLVADYAKAAGIPRRISPHALRHACATHLLQGGADIREIQELLGHRRIDTTALYTRVDVSDLSKVLARSHPRERAFHPRRRGKAE